MHKLFYLLAIALIFGTSVACTDQLSGGQANSNPPTTSPTSTPTPQPRPLTIADTISVEGEKQKITLNLYDQKGLPFTTYVPANRFIDQTVSSGEGTAVWFYALQPDSTPNKDVYVQFFFPSEVLTLEEAKEKLLESNGLFATNQWQVINRSQVQEDLYPWAKEKIIFQQKGEGDRSIVGVVFIGEYNGKAFWAVQHYPVEFGDGFEPLAGKILSNLQLRS
ncbi:hypothetical protein [Fischerella sp. PCC 9605]|uniref:hypothetical protein n=1 Tax=Fischerella sp. PCC 9605 TaxID=1173024 RepID=UPI00047C0365|nr:hypothetical protein [Fischerella sp. PCC 9605]